jgi:hypothetical protein
MQRCRQSPRYASFWVIVINNNGNASDKYHLLKFSYDQNTQRLLEPLCLRNVVRLMPSYIYNVLMAIFQKKISCSFCHQFLLDYLGRLSKQNSSCELLSMFDVEEPFALHCIYAAYHGYIYSALNVITANEELPLSRDDYWFMFKARGAMKRNTWERFHSKMTSIVPLMSS